MDSPANEFDAFVRGRTPALLRSVYLLTGDQHLAEDLVQSALARTHRAWARVHATGNAEAYTRRAMHHLQISRWRRRRVAETFTGDVPDRGARQDDHADATALRLSLRDRVLASSRRLGIRRAVGAGTAALAIAAIATAGVVGLNRAAPPTPAVTPTPVTLPDYVEPPAPGLGPFADATIVVPSWGTAAGVCTTGAIPLHLGQYVPGPHAITVLSYLRVDVDGDGADDYVAHLICGEGPESPAQQIVAFRPSHGRLVPIGRVVGTQDGFAMMDAMEVRPGGRVAVQVSSEYTDGGQQYVPSQWRVYAWHSGQSGQSAGFRQVDGPTSFPADPPSGALSVDPAELDFAPAGGGRYLGETTVTVHNSGTGEVAHAELVLFLPETATPAGDGWTGCARHGDAVHCPLPALPAHSTRQLVLRFLATAPTGEAANPAYYLRIDQLPPYTFIDPNVDPEAPLRIVVHP